LLRRLRFSYPAAGIPAMIFIFLYGNLTGMSTSTTRAVIMFVFAMIADMLGKSYDMLTALAIAAMLLLVEQPLYARSASFLLSFGSVLGIGFLYPVVYEMFCGKVNTDKTVVSVVYKGMQTLLLSLSLQILTLPLIQYFYFEISLYSIFLNFVAIPLMSILMPSAISALAISFVSVQCAWIPAAICKVILFLYEWLGEWELQLPGSVFICGRPQIWQMILYYIVIVVFVAWRYQVHEQNKWKTDEELEKENEEEKKRKEKQRNLRRSRLACAGGVFVLVLLLSWRFYTGLTFTMLDVGQGDGLFLRTSAGTACLIDGGSTDEKKVGTYRIIPFLKSQGVRKLDFVFVSHADSDHISGILELLEVAGEPGSVQVETLFMPMQAFQEENGMKLLAAAEKCNVMVQVFDDGMVLREEQSFWSIGNLFQKNRLELSCIHPPEGAVYENRNAGSLVLRLTYGEFSMLLPGDLDAEGEQQIVKKNGEKLTCDVLKVGHHGSNTSTTKDWLIAVKPKVALISCGEDNAYGHPHAEMLERLEDVNVTDFSTPECGAITIHSNGKTFWIETYKEREW